MTVQCPACVGRYRIDPTKTTKGEVRLRCPKCSNAFQVILRSPAPAPLPVPEAVAPPAERPPEKKVLVVDDSNYFRELIIDVLKPLPLSLRTAADGVEALEIIRKGRPDLVILDLNLPEMNGYEFILQVRADPALNGVKVLAMSGVYRTKADTVDAERAGADDFINKSFKPEQLQERVKGLLGG